MYVAYPLIMSWCIDENQDVSGAGSSFSVTQTPGWPQLQDGRDIHQSVWPMEIPLPRR